MAKFFGEVGYGKPVEIPADSGVWIEKIVTKGNYYGDVNRNTKRVDAGEGLNDDISVNNSISIVADDFANQHFHMIKYVEWAGVLWKVTNVEVQAPRLILSLGSVYNGPTE
jgi:hypothetical protein